MRNKVDEIAKRLGFGVKRTSECNAYYYYEDGNGFNIKNKRGETLCIEATECHSDCKGKHSLPVIWYKNGHTKEIIPDYWSFTTYITLDDGTCYGAYNPTHKRSDDGKRFEINFDWHFAATPDNFEKVMREILRLFNA